MAAPTFATVSDADFLNLFRGRRLIQRLATHEIRDEADRRGLFEDDEDDPEDPPVNDADLHVALRALRGGDMPECLRLLSRILAEGGVLPAQNHDFHGLADEVERHYRSPSCASAPK